MGCEAWQGVGGGGEDSGGLRVQFLGWFYHWLAM